jgi:transposase
MVIPLELEAKILRYYHTEKWRVGTISAQLGVHHSTVRRVIAQSGIPGGGAVRRASAIDPYLPFILETLEKFPKLTATRLFGMVTERGYVGSVDHFRHFIALHRPKPKAEAYQRLRTLPGEESQVDWAHFNTIEVGKARRALMGFVMVLSWSRMVYVHFFLGAHRENFLRGHIGAFNAWGGLTRVVLYDNLKSAVLERQGQAIRFNPSLLEFAGFYRYEPRPVAVARGNEKGRVERAIRYIRDAFFAGRTFTSVEDLNTQAQAWMTGPAADRRCPEDPTLTVREAFAQEQKYLLALPDSPYITDEQVAVTIGKTPYARFDLNDYTVPHDYVRRTLMVSADLHQVRILDGQAVVAVHPRSFGKGDQIENPEHIAALTDYKQRASQHRNTDRLSQVIPQSREFLTLAAQRGEPLARITTELLALVNRYGVTECQAAVAEALERGVPHPNAVRFALERRREARHEPPPVENALPSHVQQRDTLILAHDLTTYDQITEAGHVD